jgi:hypothetical protein
MNIDSMNNEAISIDPISFEQHLNINNQQDQNSTKPRKIDSGFKQAKKTPMTPTRLYASFVFFSQSSLKDFT